MTDISVLRSHQGRQRVATSMTAFEAQDIGLPEHAAPPPTQRRPRVLLVDDDMQLLQSIRLGLRRSFELSLAGGPEDALALVESERPYEVIVSDMRMPEMNGAQLFARIRDISPNAVRVLLTGFADAEAAAAAVNDGQVFRFLSKPCAPDVLSKVLHAAARQHELLCAEQSLLQDTLRGSIDAMGEILAIASPLAFGRATRIRRRVDHVLSALELENRWQVEVAATLSQLGWVSLAPELLERMHQGEPLAPDEAAAIARAPALVDALLARIPRLEGVRHIAAAAFEKPPKAAASPLPVETLLGAQVMRVAAAMERQEGVGAPPASVLEGHDARDVSPAVVEAFQALLSNEAGHQERSQRITIRDLRSGMVLLDDIHHKGGALLVARGQHVTQALLERIRSCPADLIDGTVRVRRMDDDDHSRP